MGLPPQFVGMAPRIATFFKEASVIYASMQEGDVEPTPDLVAMMLEMKMADWNPKVKGVSLLDEDTKAAGARFLAGIACRIHRKTTIDVGAK